MDRRACDAGFVDGCWHLAQSEQPDARDLLFSACVGGIGNACARILGAAAERRDAPGGPGARRQ